MIFDDHDVHDDWNTSIEWVKEMREKDWWRRRIVAAFASYIIYQHLGNMSPSERAEFGLYEQLRRADDDAALRAFAKRADEEVEGTRWSFCRDIGPARVVMIDSRAGRVLDPGNRSMVDRDEWELDHRACPRRRRPPADRHLAAADHGSGDALAGGLERAVSPTARGAAGQAAGREAAPGARPRALAGVAGLVPAHVALLREVGAGEHGAAPSTISVLSGDVHHAYLAEVGFPAGSGVRVPGLAGGLLAVPQSARRQGAARDPGRLDALRGRLVRALARRAGVRDPEVRWRLAHDKPWFNNQVAWLDLDGRRATFVLEKALPPEDGIGEPRDRARLRALHRAESRLRTPLRHTLAARVIIR